MSMSTYLVGFRPADEKFRKMLAALRACEVANVKVPDDVFNFFDGRPEEADEEGVRVELGASYMKELGPGVKKWEDDGSDGFQVDLRELDPSIKVLRFYNSY